MTEVDQRPPHVADAAAAAEFADAAGRLLLRLRAEAGTGLDDAARKALRDRGDARSHDELMRLIGARFPGDAVLSEEGADDAARLTADRVWIVDPLDGTREYGEPPRTDWAVHVALVEGGDLVAGAVALPALGVTYSSAEHPDPLAAPSPASPRILVSRTRRPEPILRLAGPLGGTLVEMGSAGAKAMAVVRGEAEVYAHVGGQFEWDSAAPVAVARAAGLHVSRVDGSPLRYNRPEPKLPDLLICRPELAAHTLEVLAR
ncbi:3'(2'),5'-bisphosphate nucleotidase CysQ [Tomitella fengzijianii]|uniref:3'(2'),5'-bisphosphate nucleotidase CysQ n=1 Tax=Tomitella fengzijianii TaxID=2597660 RepID=A0A516X0I5_9ACTN|nr:3'(2'),5'-bisphosphate nucleotidase CysQ [Tomitella fengzijianii]QDQ96121.1 3'(2'),5'-bisphosphate nucleotidase CysQ [Tomitella fengzijianii]